MKRAFDIVEGINNLSIVGLHCHISRCRDLKAWKKRTEIMLALSDKYFSVTPEYIDLGSGMFGLMEPSFAAQFNDIFNMTSRNILFVSCYLYHCHSYNSLL